MVGIVVAAQGGLAAGLVDAARRILGPQDQLEAVDLNDFETPEIFRRRMGEAVSRADRGEGVIVLVDMYGSGPFQTAAGMLRPDVFSGPSGRKNPPFAGVQVVTGANLPMLLELLINRGGPRGRTGANLGNLAGLALRSGREGVADMLEALRGEDA